MNTSFSRIILLIELFANVKRVIQTNENDEKVFKYISVVSFLFQIFVI